MDSIIREYNHKFDTYKRIRDQMNEEMEKGLSKKTNSSSDLKMFVSYVYTLPEGTEKGDYLALDLGGTNFRVLLINLKGDVISIINKVFPIPEDFKTGEGTKLFDHIANCISEFLDRHQIRESKLPLGFTFSFPVQQNGIASGNLAEWTKGYSCKGVVGKDVVKMLHEAIARKNLKVECVALVNDTVGCLMSCAFHDRKTAIGVIIGTGTNAAYMENIENVDLWKNDNTNPKEVIINMEWGAFGDNGCMDIMRTDVDKIIDANTVNKGKQVFEKMISGKYLGEIIRLVIIKCHRKKLIFSSLDKLSPKLETKEEFLTKYVSEIESDEDDGKFVKTRAVLKDLLMANPSLEDVRNVWRICQVITKRSCYLVSAGIAAIVNHIKKPDVTVGVDGSLYRFIPKFAENMLEYTNSMLLPGLKITMRLSEDGSGKGAALIAAMAQKTNLTKKN